MPELSALIAEVAAMQRAYSDAQADRVASEHVESECWLAKLRAENALRTFLENEGVKV